MQIPWLPYGHFKRRTKEWPSTRILGTDPDIIYMQ